MLRFLACSLLLVVACAQAQPLLLVTTSQLADVARNVAGGLVEIAQMMGPGVDPHQYRATPRDVQNLQDADLILYHGLHLEGQLADVLERFASIHPTVAVVENAIPEGDLLVADSEANAFDPHVWNDVGLFSRTAGVIATELAGLDAANAAVYEANATEYARLLRELDGWIAEAIAGIPEGSRHLVTAHDAFAYYGRAYGIAVDAIQGLSTESEAGVADIRATVRLLTESQVPAVFVESTINPRTIQAVLEAVHAAGVATGLGGELYSDAMGEPGTAEGTYVGMMLHNTSAIVSALGGDLPVLPASLRAWQEQWGSGQ